MEGKKGKPSSSRQPSISAITSETLVPRRHSYVYEQQQSVDQMMIPSSSLASTSLKLTDDGTRRGHQKPRRSLQGSSNQVVIIHPTSCSLDEDSSYALAIKSSCTSIRNSSVMTKSGYNSVSSQSSSSQSEDGDDDDRRPVNNNNNDPDQVIQSSISRLEDGSRESGPVSRQSGLKCDIVEYL